MLPEIAFALLIVGGKEIYNHADHTYTVSEFYRTEEECKLAKTMVDARHKLQTFNKDREIYRWVQVTRCVPVPLKGTN